MSDVINRRHTECPNRDSQSRIPTRLGMPRTVGVTSIPVDPRVGIAVGLVCRRRDSNSSTASCNHLVLPSSLCMSRLLHKYVSFGKTSTIFLSYGSAARKIPRLTTKNHIEMPTTHHATNVALSSVRVGTVVGSLTCTSARKLIIAHQLFSEVTGCGVSKVMSRNGGKDF